MIRIHLPHARNAGRDELLDRGEKGVRVRIGGDGLVLSHGGSSQMTEVLASGFG
ncbi:MAG: hypothetical protein AAF511_11365 [Pseudomonadota bacterium]